MGFTENINPRGYWQKGIYDIVYALVTNFNALLYKLDRDGGVADTNYEGLYGIVSPSIGKTYGKGVKPNGIYLGDLVSLCKQFRANFNSVMDKLAADGTVNGTTIFTALKFGTTTYLIDTYNAEVKPLGIHQGDFVDFLDLCVDKFDAVLARLDTDSGVSGTNFSTLLAITDVVKETSSSSSSSSKSVSSSSSSSSCRSSSSSSSSSCRSSSSSSSSSSSCRSSSSSSSSCRSSSSSSSCRSSSSSSSSSSCRSSSSSSSSCRSSSSSSSSSSCLSSSSSSSSSSSCKSSSSSSSSCRSSSSSSSSCRSSSSSSSCRSSSSSSSSSQAIT
jgi:hypothetical protein